MSQDKGSNEDLFELAKLYFDRCDYQVALEKLTQASEVFLSQKSINEYLRCQNLLMRIYAEREDSEAIRATKENLQDLVLKEGIELTPMTYYTLGVCSSHKGEFETAIEYYQKALTLALAKDSKDDICYAINGIANAYYRLKRYSDSLKEIYNLQVFFEVIDLPEVKLTTEIINAHIMRQTKKFDRALEILWTCYDLLRPDRNLYYYITLTFGIGLVYRDMGQIDLARAHFKLALKSSDPENLRYMTRFIERHLHELGAPQNDEYDLILEGATNSVTEKKRGKVDFKNQFILLELLRLFMNKPGQTYSKRDLVKQIWRQDYRPEVHDNKIYVTIKRLRKLIEPDFDKPRYIFRSKDGYYLNKATRVMLDQ